jgi:glycosyl transferase family 25
MKKYLFGASYNIFSDSIELLEHSIKSIRKSVDYISVVYSDISNFGQRSTINILPILEDLQNRKLIDKFILYTPVKGREPAYNEIAKRNIGLLLSEQEDMNYHISLDSDELYEKDQFESMKQICIDEDLDIVYYQMTTYYKEPIYILDPPEDYYVSGLIKVIKNKLYQYGIQQPVELDPTRRYQYTKYKILGRDIIEMRHLSYIRENIRTKFENSSARVNFNEDIENLIEYFNEWKYPMKALVAGKPPKFYKVKEVPPIYAVDKKNIDINSFVDHKYLINLKHDINKPHRLERYTNCVNEFKNHNINDVERFEAIDGSLISNDIRKNILLDGEIGILLTHIELIKDAKTKKYKNILVFEDDVTFADDFTERFNEYITEVPNDWNMIYLGGNHVQGVQQITKHVFKMNHSYAIHVMIIRDNMYDTIINGLQNYMKAVDVFYAELHRQTNSYVLRPHLAFQKAGVSEIQGGYVDYDFLKK